MPQFHFFLSIFVLLALLETANAHICNRPCVVGQNTVCKYKFDVQWYLTMSKACYNCPFNVTDCYRGECVPADGQRRMFAAVNRQLPGPSIELCEGDLLEVEVTNSMHIPETPITIHWHGQHQKGTNYMDGVPNLTQCRIAPGETFTYKFRPNPAGTFMYHSHVGAQLGDGFFGSMIVRQPPQSDPNSGLYDHDCSENPSGECEFTVIINDWVIGGTSLDDFVISRYTTHNNYLPKSSLINGHSDQVNATNQDNLGSYTTTPLEVFNVQKGKKYRFRLINLAAVSCRYEVAVDNHRMKVIAADGYPVQPRDADIVTLFNGERYDVVIEANQDTPGNFWFKADPIGECDRENVNATGFAILRYQNAEIVDPPGTRQEFISDTPEPITVNKVFPAKTNDWAPGMVNSIRASELTSFTDMPSDVRGTPDYTFYLAMDQLWNDPWYDSPEFYSYEMRSQYVQSTASFSNISFTFPHSPLLLNPDDMKLEIFCNEYTTNQQECYRERCRCIHMISIPTGKVVEMFLINESVNGKGSKGHPIHIHGYHAYLLAQDKVKGTSVTKAEIQSLNEAGDINKNLVNPTLRDTVQVTGGGYALWRFKTDNPGLWFFHCHVQPHMLEGQALILKIGDPSEWDPIPSDFPTCPNPKSKGKTDCPATGATAETGKIFYVYFLLTSSVTAVVMHFVFNQ